MIGIEQLTTAIAEEALALRRLLRLARIQQRAMVRGRIGLLAKVSQRISDGVLRAEIAGRARESIAAEVARGLGCPTADTLAVRGRLPVAERDGLDVSLAELSEIAVQLRRQNFQNHQLARVSTDLVRGEIDILTGAFGPAGPTYSPREDAVAAGRPGVVNGRA